MKARLAASSAAVALSRASLANCVELCAPVRRIVTVHSGSLRDLLFALPALRSLRESFDGAHITAVVREGLTPLLSSCALADEVLSRPRGGLSAYAQLMAKLHAQHGDVAIAFSVSRNGVLLAWSSGAHIRLGFENTKMDPLLTHRVGRDVSSVPSIEMYLDLVRSLGCSPRCYDYRDLVHPSVEAQQKVRQWLEERGIGNNFFLLAPQSEMRMQRDAIEVKAEVARWAEIAAALAQSAPIVALSSRTQKALQTAIRDRDLRVSVAFFDTGTAFNSLEQAALFGQARLFVGYTGGTMHLAAAMGTPIVALRSNSAPEFQETESPRGVSHRLLPTTVKSQEISRAVFEMIGL